MATRILVLKTGALGDVVRTTSILPGLARRHEDLELCWVTAPGARPLVEHHPTIDRVETVDPKDEEATRALSERLGSGGVWDRVLSFDDERPMCELASLVPCRSLSGATLDGEGRRVYTDDVAPWFEMGLLSRQGKDAADRLKVANTRTHPELFASMLGIEQGRPGLYLTDGARAGARAFAKARGLDAARPVVGLNTGAGGRWRTKELPVDRTALVAGQVAAGLEGGCSFLVLGGPEESSRNQALMRALAAHDPPLRAVDGGTNNGLLEFAALIELTDLLLSSDSMALHMGIAVERQIVCFFAPTSAAEIELYGQGEKVWSTSPDYCSYRPDADNSTLTAERISRLALEVLKR